MKEKNDTGSLSPWYSTNRHSGIHIQHYKGENDE